MPKFKLFKDLGEKAGQAGSDGRLTADEAAAGRPHSEFEDILFEGHGPGGTAMMLRCLTDDRGRTAAELSAIFEEFGGRLGESGSVSGLFREKGLLVVDREYNDEDEDAIVMTALECGAEDVIVSDECYEIVTVPDRFEKVKNALKREGYGFASAAVRRLPLHPVKVKGDNAWKLLKMMDAFEDNEDVRNVYANFDIEDDEN